MQIAELMQGSWMSAQTIDWQKLPIPFVPSLLRYISQSSRMQSLRQSAATELQLNLYIGGGQ